MPDFPHQHLLVPASPQRLDFKPSGRGKFKRLPDLDRARHAESLQHQVRNIEEQFSSVRQERFEANVATADDFGLILNFESAPDYPLKLDSLEQGCTKNKDGIYLLNVRYKEVDGHVITSAAVLVPYGRLNILANKLTAFANPSKDTTNKDGITSPSGANLFSNIKSIGVAALDALWMEPEALPDTDEPLWWELWISRASRAETSDQSWQDKFHSFRESLGLEINPLRILMPENEIVLLKATRSELEGSLELLNTLTEVRKFRSSSIGLTDLSGAEQHEWIDEAIDRIQWPSESAPAVCLLDTGVNRGHKLLENLISDEDLFTIHPQRGVADLLNPKDAHGTPMAGIAAYDDLRRLILSTKDWIQAHRLESVKLIHTGGDNHPYLYGAATQQAILIPESKYPERPRVYCLAISEPSYPNHGHPSSWSAAIDASAVGAGEEGNPKRIIVIAAGNQQDFLNYNHPDSNCSFKIENPGQSWNGITVGAITRLCDLTEDDDESRRSRALAPHNTLSPHSSTSCEWKPQWPIKPDIVMEGGNVALSESGELFHPNSLELLTTASDYSIRPLTSMAGTSPASASASRLIAQLMAKYPGYQPETYRGLLVNSARWNSSMLGTVNPHRPRNKAAVQQIMRQYGFGEPNQSRLFGSGESGVTMIIEDTLQPYDLRSEPKNIKLGEFNLHELPWPSEVFNQHQDVELTMRATLSYYMYPSPGSRAGGKNSKYLYASHLLRFKVKNRDESEERFKGSLQADIRSEEAQLEFNLDEGSVSSDSQWAVGPQLRGKGGSLVQDVWKGTAAQLAEMGQIAVFPVKGWFGIRYFPEGHEFHNCYRWPAEYSLIISIDAEQEIGLYTEIVNQISILV